MISLADLKLALRLDPDDTTEDDYVTALEAAAVRYVERWTGRGFGATDAAAAFTLPGSGTATLVLPQMVSAVSAVTERLYLGDAGTALLSGDADGWALVPDPGQTHSTRLIRKGGNVWQWGYEYAVTATTGYAADGEPEDIRQAVTMLTAHWYENRIPVALGTVAPDISHSLTEILRPWKRMVA